MAKKDKKPKDEGPKLSAKETYELLAGDFNKKINKVLDKYERDMQSDAAKNGGKLSSDEGKTFSNLIHREVQGAFAVNSENIKNKDYKIVQFDKEVLENFKNKRGEFLDMTDGMKPFSGEPKDIKQQIQSLREEVKAFTDSFKPVKQKSSNIEASAQRPLSEQMLNTENTKIHPTIQTESAALNGSKTTKLSSEQTWNMLAGAAVTAAGTKITEMENATLNANQGGKLDMQSSVKTVQDLKTELTNAFEAEISKQQKDHNLDKKTADLFKQNSGKLVDHIIDNSNAFSAKGIGGKIDIKDAMDTLREGVHGFNQDIRVDENKGKSNWKKAADFCKSAKLDRLAEYCQDKHVQSLVKGVSKELGVKLAGHKSSDPNNHAAGGPRAPHSHSNQR